MGFYGQVVNYLAKAFSRIKVGNTVFQAAGYDDAIEFKGDDQIEVIGDSKEQTVSFTHTKHKVEDNGAISVLNGDLSAENATITVTLPVFDEYGHVLKYQDYKTTVNVNSEAAKRAAEIGDEQDRAMRAEKDLESSIENTYDYINEVKLEILGDGKLVENFNTLLEIGNWIEDNGVDVVDLTTTIAEEAQIRSEADKNLNSRVTELNTSVSIHENTINQLVTKSNEFSSLYETKDDAEKKLTAAKYYTDKRFSGLQSKVEYNDTVPTYFVSGVSYKDGKFTTILSPLPYKLPEQILYRYDEESGNLIFPQFSQGSND